MKEIKLILVESNDKCTNCIFNVYGECNEPFEIDCDYMGPNKNKKYHWELDITEKD